MSRMSNASGNTRKKWGERIIGQPIIEKVTKKEIMDIHIYLMDNDRFQIIRKKVMFKKYLQFQPAKKYCWREKE